jgi:integrase
MKGKSTAFGFALSDEAVRILRAARRLIPADRVFGQENFYTEAFKKAARRAGPEGLRWHDLRHTGASWAVQRGVTLPELMVLGGWKSYRKVLRYAHLSPSNAAAAAQTVGTQVAQSLKAKRRA